MEKEKSTKVVMVASCVACVLSIVMDVPLVIVSMFASIPISMILLPMLIFNGKTCSLREYRNYICDMESTEPEVNTYKQRIIKQVDVFISLMNRIDDSFFLNYSRGVSSGYVEMKRLCERKLIGSLKRVTVYLATVSAKGFLTERERMEINKYIDFNSNLINAVADLSNSIALLGEEDMALERIRFFISSVEEIGGDLNI